MRAAQDAAWERERLLIVVFTEEQQILGVAEVPPASVTASRLRRALRGISLARAGGLIGVHNQPDARPKPLQSASTITKRLRTVADELGVPLLDHLIFSRGRYSSMVDRGRL